MMRRLTIACGFLTLAVVFVLAVQDHTLFGARSPHSGASTNVSTIPDKPPPAPPKPAPPLKGWPPRPPRPQPLNRAPAQAQPPSPAPSSSAAPHSTIQQVVDVARTIFNLPKVLDDQTHVNPGH